jgi:hypothetical protein
VLGLICIADMIYTLLLVRSGQAIEANPILAPFMAHGIGCFFAAKTVLDVIPLCLLEHLRSKRPIFVKKMLRVGIATYLLSYGIGVVKINHAHIDTRTQIANVSPAISAFSKSKVGPIDPTLAEAFQLHTVLNTR